MNLQTQKKVFWTGIGTLVAGTAVGTAVWGLAHVFSGSSDKPVTPPPAPTATTATATKPAPQTTPAYPTTTVTAAPPTTQVQTAPVKQGDNADQKTAKLNAMFDADKTVLANNGYNIGRRLGFGNCTDNGTVDASGWHGVSSGISYEATKSNGQAVVVCVTHKGGKPQNVTGSPIQTVTPAQTSAPATAPVQQAAPATSTEKETKLAAMFNEDKVALGERGFTILNRLGVGTCTSNGAVDTSGWHGVSSGISYEAVKNGQHVKMCVAHKGGKPKEVTGSKM